jgi:hypothetical protein
MCDSFREFMAPNELKGRRLKGPDQAMMQAQDRLKADCPNDSPGTLCAPMSTVDREKREHDWKAVSRFDKRKERGGSMFKAGHIIG